MPLGDSITEGIVGPGSITGGYRQELYSLLSSAGFTVDYVGTLNYPNALAEGWVDGDHEGHSGYKIEAIRSNAAFWIKRAGTPDVILLHAGTNDFWTGSTVSLAGKLDEFRNLVSELSALAPHARIIVAGLILRTDAFEAGQVEFSQSLPGLVATQAALGRKVSFVDLHGGPGSEVLLPGDLSDNVHPNSGGYDKMGAAWLPAIDAVLNPTGVIDPPAIAALTARTDLEHVTVVFNKPIAPADVLPGNFSISPAVSVTGASLDSTQRVVTLTTATQPAATAHTLTVSGIHDLESPQNLIAPGAAAGFTSRAFVDGSFEWNDSAWVKTGVVEVSSTSLAGASDGTSLVVFNAANLGPGGSISQTIPTVPNQKYRIQFDMGVYAVNTSPQSLRLVVKDGVGTGGADLITPAAESMNGTGALGTPRTVWRILSYQFTAASSQTTILFDDASTVTTSVDLLLDDVRLDAVPNENPVAVDDGSITTPKVTVTAYSGPLTPMNVLGNDSDPDGGTLTVTAAASPHGSVAINGNQTLSFTPDITFTGGTTISYTIADGQGGSAEATVWVSVDPVAEFTNGSFEDGAPVSLQPIPTGWGTSGSVAAYPNDSGNYLPPRPANGTWMAAFNPGNNNFPGSISQTFATTPGQTYKVEFDVGIAGGVGRKQTLVAAVSGTLTPAGQPTSWELTSTGPAAAWLTDRSITFSATEAATTLSFSVANTGSLATDVDLLLDYVRVTETAGANQTPVAGNDAFSVNEDGSLTVLPASGVLFNDTDDGPAALTAILVDNVSHGTLSLAADGGFTYTPTPNFSGSDSFIYKAYDSELESAAATVTLTVHPLNDAPTALADAYSTPVGTPLVVAAAGVLANDADDGPPPLTAVMDSPPAHGTMTAALGTDGAFTYTPNPGFVGTDFFTYHASDGTLVSSVVKVWISVGPLLNSSFEQGTPAYFGTLDAWTVTGGVTGYATDVPNGYVPLVQNGDRFAVFNPGNNDFTGALSQTFATVPGKIYQIDLDIGIGGGAAGRTQSLFVSVTNGTSATLPTTESIQSAGTLAVWESRSHTFTATDATATITFSDVSGPLVAGVNNFSDLLLDNVRVTELSGTNQAPVANDDGTAETPFVTVAEDSGPSVPILVLTNDSDLDPGDVLTITAQSSPNGTVTRSPDNLTLIFTPAANFSGPATISYTITDGHGGADNATVFVLVTPVNDAPVAVADNYGTTVDTPLAISAPGVLANDTDDGPPPLTAVIDALPANGTLTVPLGSDGGFTYTPNAGFSGIDTFTYHASDGALSSSAVTITITVGMVVNGSFEQGDPVDFGPLDGWTRVGGVIGYGTDVPNGYIPLPLNGSRMAVFNPGADDFTGVISQTLATIPGKIYQVDFDMGIGGGLANRTHGLKIEVTGTSTQLPATETIVSTGKPAIWAPKSFVFTATSTTTTLTFSDVTDELTGVTKTSADLLLDDVRVTQLPGGNEIPVAVADSYSTDEDTPLTIPSLTGVLANDSDDGPAALTATLVQNVASGTLNLASDGGFTYTPAANFSGDVTFTYTAGDSELSSAETTVTLTINPVNDVPVAMADGYAIDEDTPLTVPSVSGLLANDTDDGPAALTATLVENVASGTLNLAPDGGFTYTPAANFSGDVTFTYTAGDSELSSAETTVTLTINPVNDVPVAMADAYSTDEDMPLTVPALSGVLANDTDDGSVALTATLVQDVASGTLNLASNGGFTYTPAANAHGAVTFSYKAGDGAFESDIVTVTITVNSVDDPPVADDQAVALDEDASLPITLTGSDDGGGSPIFAVLGGPSHGTFKMNGSVVTYTPDKDFYGQDAIYFVAFTFSGGPQVSSTATVTITVNPVNDPPVALAQGVSVNEDGSVDITLTANDPDPEDTLIFAAGTPAHGTLNVVNGVATYMPVFNYNGPDSFTFTVSDATETSPPAQVSITVDPVNDAPVAVNEGSLESPAATIEEDALTPAVIPAIVNDSDVDLDPLTISTAYSPDGTVTAISGNTELSFAPAPDFNGLAVISYTVTDNQGGTADAMAYVRVSPVNDAPVAAAGSATVNEDESVDINLSASDVDTGDVLSYQLVAGPASGTVNISGNVATYTPTADFNGPASFTFKANDSLLDSQPAQVTVTVTPVNDAPAALAGTATVNEDESVTITLNGSDLDGDVTPENLIYSVTTAPLHGSLDALSGRNLVYTPNADFNGTDTIVFKVNDGALDSPPALVSVTVTPVNDAPAALAGTASVNEDETVNITLNGSDLDGDMTPENLSYAVTAGPQHGSLDVLSGRNLVYTPGPDYNGTDTITFKVSDGALLSQPADVVVTVSPVNDTPVADAGSASVNEDAPANITLTGSDVDDTDVLTYQLVTIPANGTVNISGNVATYTPNANFNGPDSFTFQVNDGTANSVPASVTVNVAPVNDAPVALAATATLDEDGSVNITLGGSDLDGDVTPENLTYTVTVNPLHGTLQTSGRNLVYTPATDYNGPDSLTFIVSDSLLTSLPAQVDITVNPVNDAPLASAASTSVNEDGSVNITLIATDIDGSDTVTLAKATDPTNGSLTITGNVATYTPNANFNGPDSFTFKANDGFVDSLPAVVSITVIPVDDVPVANAQVVSTNEDTPLPITLIGTDIDGDTLFFTTGNPSHGTLLQSGAVVTYTPAANYHGTDSFSFFAYSILNGLPVFSQAKTVTITVASVNDAPVAVNDGSAESPALTVEANSGASAPITVLTNDSDIDLDPLTVTAASSPNGTVTINGGGTLVFIPATNFSGATTIGYTISDGNLTATATVYAMVNPAAGLDSWLDGFGLVATAGEDSDGDSISNAVEYVIGGNPANEQDTDLLPTVDMTTAGYLTFTYFRTDLANEDPHTTIGVEWGTSLTSSWTAADGTHGEVVEVEDVEGEDYDRVKVRIPRSLAPNGKLFARLGVLISQP